MSNKIMRDRISLDQLDRVVKEIVQTLLKILQTESCPAFYSDEFQHFSFSLRKPRGASSACGHYKISSINTEQRPSSSD
jgi:hypothetical protein